MIWLRLHLPPPCQWCVWWAAPTQQLPLLDTGPPACTGDCWPGCRRPSPGPASHPSYCRQHTTQSTQVTDCDSQWACSLSSGPHRFVRPRSWREFTFNAHFHLNVRKTWQIYTSSKNTHTHTCECRRTLWTGRGSSSGRWHHSTDKGPPMRSRKHLEINTEEKICIIYIWYTAQHPKDK